MTELDSARTDEVGEPTVISQEGVVTEVAGYARDTAPTGRAIIADRRGRTTRLLVTGVGVVAPTGVGVEEHWQSLLRGELRVRPIEGFDPSRYCVTLAGQVLDFDPGRFVAPQLKVQTDRWSWMSLAAATLAAEDAGYVPPEEAYATSVFLAAGSGGNEFSQHEIQGLWAKGPRSSTRCECSTTTPTSSRRTRGRSTTPSERSPPTGDPPPMSPSLRTAYRRPWPRTATTSSSLPRPAA